MPGEVTLSLNGTVENISQIRVTLVVNNGDIEELEGQILGKLLQKLMTQFIKELGIAMQVTEIYLEPPNG
jgi:hypothetical protein